MSSSLISLFFSNAKGCFLWVFSTDPYLLIISDYCRGGGLWEGGGNFYFSVTLFVLLGFFLPHARITFTN